jgi:replicative DNA helicase
MSGEHEYYAEADAAAPPRGSGAPEDNGAGSRPPGLLDGAAFALDQPEHIPAVWGDGRGVLWAAGEPLMLYGPDGVGKTTVGQQLLLRRVGIGAPELFGLPVAPHGRGLYLALDRPRQAGRSMRRMVSEEDRALLTERVCVWPRSVPFDIVRNPSGLLAFTLESGCRTVLIDSVKDLAPNLSDEESGAAFHKACQLCLEAEIEVVALHHPRKAQADNKKPRTLADVYGSRWLTAGMGSVILLWGDAGDPVVKLEHLKQPAEIVGPFELLHDAQRGTTIVIESNDPAEIVIRADKPMTVGEVAKIITHKPDPPRSDVEKTRRRLDSAASDRRIRRIDAPAAGLATFYQPIESEKQ